MLEIFNQFKESGSWNEACDIFGKFLGMEEPLPSSVLLRAAEDRNFARYLLTSRGYSYMLKQLVDDSKNRDFELGKDGTGIRSLPEVVRELFQLAYDSYSSPEEIKYNKKYRFYFGLKESDTPDTKPCKPCAEIKAHDFREVYLDHNATTPIRTEVSNTLVDYYTGKLGFGNPSSNTVQGYYTYDLVRDARQKIANCLLVSPGEIFFTGSGSESNNLAIKGIAFRHLDQKGHIITSKVEHPSVLLVMEYLETLGFSVTYLDVDEYGKISPNSVKQAIKEDTILVSIMAANNEIGTINPISEIGQICREHSIPFMVDAIQAFGKMPLNPKTMGISLLSFSGHKIYAPKGIGGLYVEEGLTLVPQIHGGNQEEGLRSGTENIGSILAFGKAAELAYTEMEQETERLLGLRNLFLEELKKIEPDFIVNGSLEYRIPNNLSIGFPRVDSSALLRSLNRIGISASAGSACSSRRIKTSHVLKAIGVDTENYATICFSFGLETKEDDLGYLFKYLKNILELIKEG